MSKYKLEASLPFQSSDAVLEQSVIDAMWRVFMEIGKFWDNNPDPELMKTNFIVFINNRIKVNPTYADEYRNAADVIEELITLEGEVEAFNYLFTDPDINNAPPTTRVARVRQLVSNEFIKLQLALGGFKTFGSTLNYPGYFGGANMPDHTPYRTS